MKKRTVKHVIVKEKDYFAQFLLFFLFTLLWAGICFVFALLIYNISPIIGTAFGTASFLLGLWKATSEGFFKLESIERVEHVIKS